ncbi:MAG: ABC transporter ATP-binding protein [Candidatus Anammoxibacter sp.]
MRTNANNFLEDEIVGKAYDSKLIKRLLTYLKPYKTKVILSIITLMVISCLQLVGPYLTKIVIDNHIRVGDWSGINQLGLIYVVVLFVIFVLQYLQVYIMRLVGQNVMYDLRSRLFAHVQKMSLSFFDRNPVGRLMTRIVNDVEVLNELFTSGLVVVFGDFFILIGITVTLFVLNWKLALIAFAIMPFLIYASILYRGKARSAYREIRVNLARLNSHLHENISGINTVQAFGKEEYNFKKFNHANLENCNSQLRSVFYNAVFFPIIEVFTAVSISAIIWYGGGQVIKGAIMPGVLVAFILYLQRFFKPIRDLTEKYNIMQSAMASSERIFKLLDTPEDIPNPASPRYVDTIRGDIVFENVWFSYNPSEADQLEQLSKGNGGSSATTFTGNNYVLKDISFHLKPGESVAIVGATGSGKTSIINLLGRFYDIQRGRIFVDGIDISKMDKYQLRKNIGIVLQDVFLFTGDIEYNITIGNDEIPFSKVKEAATYVNADSFINKLPDNYHHEVYERGNNLSQGQKQLLAFARALAYDPKILILDEATSSVDTETELLIRDALNKLISGRTSIIVAHRLSTIKEVDKIIVLKNGKIAEEGAHEELLGQRGIYYNLYKSQYQDVG